MPKNTTETQSTSTDPACDNKLTGVTLAGVTNITGVTVPIVTNTGNLDLPSEIPLSGVIENDSNNNNDVPMLTTEQDQPLTGVTSPTDLADGEDAFAKTHAYPNGNDKHELNTDNGNSKIISGVTRTSMEVEPSDTRNAQPSENTLPDLVLNRTGDQVTESLSKSDDNTVNYSSTVDPFDSPIPSEIDKASRLSRKDHYTTEEVEDAIDGLLSLANNSHLQPIGSLTPDAAPTQVKLSTNDVKQAQKAMLNMSLTDNDNNNNNHNNNNNTRGRPTNHKSGPLRTSSPKPTSPMSSPAGSRTGTVKFKSYKLKRKADTNKKYKCSKCKHEESPIRVLNQHYKNAHGAVMCGTCNKMFTSKLLLSHHMYDHLDKKYFCKKCGDGFFFKSELSKHKVIHEEKGTFQCMSHGCGHWFKRSADLTVHLPVHDKKTWKCDRCEDYTTTCEKYLKHHIRTNHDPVGPAYSCDLCSEPLKYRMQLKRHKKNKKCPKL